MRSAQICHAERSEAPPPTCALPRADRVPPLLGQERAIDLLGVAFYVALADALCCLVRAPGRDDLGHALVLRTRFVGL